MALSRVCSVHKLVQYKQYGRQRLKAESIQSILQRKSCSACLHVSWADQISATVSSTVLFSVIYWRLLLHALYSLSTNYLSV